MAGVSVFLDGTPVEILDPSKIKVQQYTYNAAGSITGRSWVDVQAIKVMVGGVWQDVWPKPFANIENYSVYGSPVTVAYRINSNGYAEYGYWNGSAIFYGTIEKWLKKGSASQFVVKAEKDANPAYSVPTGSPVDQWIDASTSPEWRLEEVGLITLLTVTIGRVDGDGEGLGITDHAGVELQDESGEQLTDTNITVTPMDSAQITMNTWTE